MLQRMIMEAGEAYLDLLECGLFLGAVGVDGQHAIAAPDRHMLSIRTTTTRGNNIHTVQYEHFPIKWDHIPIMG